ncbi:MAG: hypothetical protein GPJ54_15600 [Candidatus Heimdallarchaeota archaeon]|nr:hypothetical protein [Candidatus Heimdallarchaeota archaeon]
MSFDLSNIEDLFLFLTGILLVFVSTIFFNLFKRYRKRDYLLFGLGFLAAAVQTVVRKMDVLFPENWDSEIPNIFAAIFGFIMVGMILFVLIFPHKVPIDFQEQLIKSLTEEE